MNKLSRLSHYARYKLAAKDAHGIHSPFVFHLYTDVIEETHPYYEFGKLSKIRQELAGSGEILTITDFGAGSKIFRSNERKIADICEHGIAPEKYARLLFRLVNFAAPSSIIELGTSLGLTTMYLAAANKKAKVYTLEGAPALADFAKKQFAAHGYVNIEMIRGNFDEQLIPLIAKLPAVDFAYIDGNHSKAPTLRYFEQLLEKCHSHSVLVFDDINWSDDMREAWEAIKAHPKVRLTLDFYFLGVVFFRQEHKEKEHFVIKY